MKKVTIGVMVAVVLVSADDWQIKKSEILQNAEAGVSSSRSSSSGKWTVEGERLKMELKRINDAKKLQNSTKNVEKNKEKVAQYSNQRDHGQYDFAEWNSDAWATGEYDHQQ